MTSLTVLNIDLLHDSNFRESLFNSSFTCSLGSIIFGVRSWVCTDAREMHETFNTHFSGHFSNVASTNDVDGVRSEISTGPPLIGEIDNYVASEENGNYSILK